MKEINIDKLLKIIKRYELRILELGQMQVRFAESKKFDLALKYQVKMNILKSVVNDLKNLL